MTKWVVLDADKVCAQLIMNDDAEPSEIDGVTKGMRSFPVCRFGKPGEQFDPAAQKWVMTDGEEAAAAVDAAHCADHGAAAIDIARRFKALEARIMLAGVAIDGGVAAEARSIGQDPMMLAATIAAAAADNEAVEIARILSKRAARAAAPAPDASQG